MKKRVLSLIMAFMLCLSLMPTEVLAQGTTISTESGAEDREAKTGTNRDGADSERKTGTDRDSAGQTGTKRNNADSVSDGNSSVSADSVVNTANVPMLLAANDADTDNVAEVTIGGTPTQYTDINEAFAAAQEADSATVTLLSDVTIAEAQNGIYLEKGNITFDLNGHTLTSFTGSDWMPDIVLWVNGTGGDTPTYAALTLKDSSNGSGKIVQTNGIPAILVDEYGKLTVEGGIIENSTTDNRDILAAYRINCAILTSGETIIRGGTMSGINGVVVNGGTLTATDGTFTGTTGNALIVHDGTAQLSGGTYSNDTDKNEHSIWVMNDGKASSLLAEGYRYETTDGKVSAYSENGNGVVGNTTVKERPAGEFFYIDATGKEAVQTGCKELTSEALYGDSDNLVGGTMWYAASGDITLDEDLGVRGTLNLILCDGATVTAGYGIFLGYSEGPGVLNIYAQSAGTGRLTVTNEGMSQGRSAGIVSSCDGSSLNIYGGTVTATGKTCIPTEVGVPDYSGAGIGTCANDQSGITLNVNIYGGTVIAKSGGKGAAAIGNGQAATGTVNVKIAEGMKCVQTDDLNTPAAYDNTDGTSVTITKCSDHQWGYTQDETNHTSKCKLCGAAGITEAHDYKNWKADEDADTHTGTCVCGAEKTEDHTLTYRLSTDKKSHYSECSICGYESAEELHDTNGTDGGCSVCGADKDIAVEKAEVVITAPDGTVTTTKYADLIEAFDDADTSRATKIEVRLQQNGKTYTLDSTKDFPIKFGYTNQVEVIVDLNGCTLKRSVTDDTYGILKVEKGNVTIKNGTLELDDSACAAQAIKLLATGNKPTLTLENMTVKAAKGYAVDTAGECDLYIKSGTYGKVLINDNFAAAKLSGGSYGSVECYVSYAKLLETGYIFAKQSDDSYIDPSDMSYEVGKDQNTKDIKVIECKHEGGYTDGSCKRCGVECGHTGVDESGQCSVCRMQMVAQDNSGKYFTTLAAAIEAAKNNGTVTLLADEVEENITIADGTTVTIDLNGKTWQGYGTGWAGYKPVPLTVSGGSVTVQNGTLKQGGASDNANTAVIVNGGSLTVGEKMTIQGSKYDSSTVLPAITVESGSLTLTENTNLYGGMKAPADKTLADYLPEGTAFVQTPDEGAGSFVNGYVHELTGGFTLTVRKHTHSVDSEGKCACGFACTAHHFENGKCTVCGYACPHEHVTEAGEAGQEGYTTASCDDCNEPLAVKVTSGGTNTYYAKKSTDPYGDNTLQTLLNDDTITPLSDCTVTLLMNDLLAVAYVDGGKNITLDLNGKNLIETGSGICVDLNSTLTVTGEGSSRDAGEFGLPCVFNVRGGTLVFKEMEFGGTFNSVRVGNDYNTKTPGTLTSRRDLEDSIHIGTLEIEDSNAKVSFKSAAFDKIAFGGTSGSVKLGDLLGVWKDAEGNTVRSGNAFQTADGTFLRYDTEITGTNPVENVKTAACHHDSVTGRTCDYCGTKNITAMVIDGGGAIATYAADDDSPEAEKTSVGYALNGWKNNGNNKTLKLFVDVTLTADVSLDAGKHPGTGAKLKTTRVIDLNGHSFTGAGGTAYGMVVNELVTLTVKDNSAGKKGEFVNVTVNDGGSLIVDGVHVGTITAAAPTAKVTLKAGSSFEGYSLPDGMMLADWIEEGCFIYDTGADGKSKIPVALTETGAKTAAGKFVVEKAAVKVTAGTKTGEIVYGSGVSVEFCPEVTITDTSAYENFGFIKVDWYRRTDSGCKQIGSGTIKDGSYAVTLITPDFDGVKAGDILEVFCTITAVDNTGDETPFWQTVTTGYKLKVVKGNSSVLTAPAATVHMVYKAAETNKTWPLVTAGTVEGGTMVYSLTKDGTYTEAIPTAENAGSYTVWYKVRGDENHTDTEPESVTAKIEKAPVTISSFDWKEKIYDGTTGAEVNGVNFKDETGKPVDSELVLGTDYTVTAAFEDANAGDSVKVTAIVTLQDTERAGNYLLTRDTVQDTSAIRKADAPAAAEGTLYILSNRTGTYTLDLSRLLPGLDEGCEFGTVTFSTDGVIWEKAVYQTETCTINGKLLELQATSMVSAEENAGTAEIKVVTDNYKDFTLTVRVVSTDKKIVELKEGSKVSVNGKLTYGQKLSELTLGSAVFVELDTDTEVKGTLKWSSPDAVPNAGTSWADWIFTPDESGLYKEVTGSISITVEKADPAVTGLPVVAERVYDPNTALADSDLTGGTVSVAGSWSFAGTGIIPTVDNTGYEAVFTPDDTTNYNAVTKTITVKVTKATPYIAEQPSAAAITYGKALADSILTGGKAAYKDENGAEIAGSFAWKQRDLKPAVSDSGVTEYEVTFTPADTVNYNTVDTKILLTVNKAAYAPNMPGDTMQPAHSTIRISDITLPDGWSWADADKDKELADKVPVTAKAVYNGADKDNYETVSVSVTITRSECEHRNTEIRNQKDATCTQTGYAGDTYCADCGVFLTSGKETTALGHDYKSAVTKEPTTTEEGVRTYTCSRCHAGYTESIAKLSGGSTGSQESGNTGSQGSSTGSQGSSTGSQESGNAGSQGGSTGSQESGNAGGQGSSTGSQESSITDSRTNAVGEEKPYIKDENGKEGWEAIRLQLEDSEAGAAVTVVMNGTTVVPKNIFDNIRGEDVTLSLDMGDGITWIINGKEIAEVSGDIDLGVTMGTQAGKSIPVEVINSVAGEHYSTKLTLSYDGEFGFTAGLVVKLDSENAGLYANLFYYNEQTGKPEFISAGEIGEDGSTELVFTHASDYIIVIGAEMMDGNGENGTDNTESTEAGNQSAPELTDDTDGQSVWNTTVIIIAGICILLIVIGAVWYVRKKGSGKE